ncbi:hypothetical protein ANCCEY_04480 [Ancylostoma ceylanicum]|uniref:Uncharacterized protein n=1 Tax=Ancylostoma ceylanicum TaxID=53326 RepID=A0A0D6M9A7_9BILA|nr:hypothetical protein ANCCEY_04480 [Ancylostoma ceylanicum]
MLQIWDRRCDIPAADRNLGETKDDAVVAGIVLASIHRAQRGLEILCDLNVICHRVRDLRGQIRSPSPSPPPPPPPPDDAASRRRNRDKSETPPPPPPPLPLINEFALERQQRKLREAEKRVAEARSKRARSPPKKKSKTNNDGMSEKERRKRELMEQLRAVEAELKKRTAATSAM